LPNRYGHCCGQCYHGLCAFPSSKQSPERSWPFLSRGPGALDPFIWESYIFSVTVFTSV
jgi:hypothetical protein